ncbi:hypothetical protein PLCT2_00476 [Planctomycetaceae bacterium]|nr:hypothetical protein PLCT2_00476 [Planctomycetaceae bacterium]
MTRDRSTETWLRYDWRGQLWVSDDDSDFSTPERYYTYDCQGRRKIEEQWYEASHHLFQTLVFTPFCACATGNCSGDIAGDFTEMVRTLDANGLLLSSTEHMIGLAAHGTGSSSAKHSAAIFVPGGRPAGDAIVAERVVQGATIHTYWRCEDQLHGRRRSRLKQPKVHARTTPLK